MINLITGATGHLGNVLARELVSQGDRVRALLLPNDIHCPLDGLDVECVEGDVLDPESLESAMDGVNTVYHLAGIISILPGANTLMQRVNVEGVRNVATAALHAGVQRFVHVSSVHAFQRMPEGTIVDETVPLAVENAAGTYDMTKAQGTLAVLESFGRGLNAVIACPSAIIGPYDFRGSLLGSTLIRFAKQRFQFLIPGAYDFVDVRDVAHGLILARDKGHAGEIYILSGTYATLQEAKAVVQRAANVCSGHLVLPWRVATACAGAAQHIYRLAHIKPQFTPYALRTLHENARFSSEKARRELGFQTRSLLETARDLLTWRQSLSPA